MLSQSFAHVKQVVLLLLFLVLASAASVAQTTRTAKQEDVMKNILFKNALVKSGLNTFFKGLGIEVQFDEAVKNDKFDMEAHEVTLKTVIQALLQQKGLRAGWSEEKKIVTIFPDTEEMRKKYEELKAWPIEQNEKK